MMSGENRIAYYGVKRQFDANAPEDLREYQHFLTMGRWSNTCPFITEPPWESVIFLIERRIAEVWLDQLIYDAEHGRWKREKHREPV